MATEKQKAWVRPQIGSITLAVIVSLYILIVANYTFWSRAFVYFDGHRLAFAGFVAGMIALTIAIAVSVSMKYLIKPALIFLVLAAVAAAWFTDRFGVIIDREMLRNAAVTTQSEAQHLITAKFVLHMLLAGVLPSLAIAAVRVVHRPFWSKFLHNTAVVLPCIGVVAVTGMGFYSTYAAVGRIHRDLMMTINPHFPIGSAIYFAATYGDNLNVVRQPIGTDARQIPAAAPGKPRVLIIVAGETARGQEFSLGGYGRDTNPEMKARNVTFFPDVTSCGTETAVSIPCMFSVYPRTQYSHRKGLATDNLTDVLGHAKIDVEWWDNDTGTYGVADRIKYKYLPNTRDPRFCKDGECLDTILLDKLDDWLANVKGDSVLVLHQLGSHGPAYYQRYPDDSRRFTPDCRVADFANCKPEEVTNAYDNTIVMTDHVVASVIDKLKAHQDKLAGSMLYLSDHGESLGENGIYLHGAPYFIAPRQQTHVPMALWLSDAFASETRLDRACIAAQAERPASHDNFFHSVLGLMQVETSVRNASLDIISPCRKPADKLASN
ncbi:phosphoethanolamine transferase [Rhizobium sp. P32RR-XVIII]|uniref:phosphoethanolamine transferase n=1 Tax=Rhizobium sp. P32RR-XVIII TaxID=2726738 RepID=UPI001456F862|nr:phosphoethanolamine--lipid A transferase [Rhizobium sp. P32RR-XVIII]NLS03566.1 phosphoethanolamine transferase [Rhizobium sp. P32RR-XVIII]